MYRELDPQLTTQSIERLARRISERFPDSGLAGVRHELPAVGLEAEAKSAWISRPNLLLRSLVALVIGGAVTVLVFGLTEMELKLSRTGVGDVIQIVDAGVNTLVIIGAALIFLVTVENRVKRYRTLEVLHELRSLAHVIGGVVYTEIS